MFSQLEEASWDWFEMVQALLQAPSYHLVFEAALIIWIVRLLFMKSYKPEKTVLTQQEKDELVKEWVPEPLVPDVPEDNVVLNNILYRTVDSKIGKYISVNGNKCLNFASLNFLNMLGHPDIEESAVNSIKKYGVGTCGPRGFYGTIDVHLTLEENIANFMNSEEAILYSYGFATIASAIPAYSKRGDVIFCDEAVCFAIQKGIQASRSVVYYFKHNDMNDLERLLQMQQKRDIQNPPKAKVVRRFLIVEGIYMNYGDLCPLPELVQLKEKYKVRLFIDESLSFGVLGKCGRGVTEHFSIPVDDVDLISVSVEYALGSIGGLCVGKLYIIEHQRVSGQGYTFSASLPALNTMAAIEALNILKKNPSMLQSLKENSIFLHGQLESIPDIKVLGEPFVPIKHLQLAESCGERHLDFTLLQYIVNLAEEAGLCLTQAFYLENEEKLLPEPSIRIAVCKDMEKEDIKNAVKILCDICHHVLN